MESRTSLQADDGMDSQIPFMIILTLQAAGNVPSIRFNVLVVSPPVRSDSLPYQEGMRLPTLTLKFPSWIYNRGDP